MSKPALYVPNVTLQFQKQITMVWKGNGETPRLLQTVLSYEFQAMIGNFFVIFLFCSKWTTKDMNLPMKCIRNIYT